MWRMAAAGTGVCVYERTGGRYGVPALALSAHATGRATAAEAAAAPAMTPRREMFTEVPSGEASFGDILNPFCIRDLPLERMR